MILRRKFFSFLLVIIVVQFSACVTGLKTETKSPLNYLDGKNYRYANPQGIPFVVQRNTRSTFIEGKVSTVSHSIPYPFSNKILVLVNSKNEEVARAHTANDGHFKFAATIHNGKYKINSLSKKYDINYAIEVSSHEHKGLHIFAKAAK